jgi:hypothetical protein
MVMYAAVASILMIEVPKRPVYLSDSHWMCQVSGISSGQTAAFLQRLVDFPSCDPETDPVQDLQGGHDCILAASAPACRQCDAPLLRRFQRETGYHPAAIAASRLARFQLSGKVWTSCTQCNSELITPGIHWSSTAARSAAVGLYVVHLPPQAPGGQPVQPSVCMCMP